MFVRDYAVGHYTLRIYLGDITDLAVDAIVNSENEDMRMDHPEGNSVSAAIRRRGGEKIARELARSGPVPLGAVRVTGGGDLAAPFVLHPAVVWERQGVRYTDARVLETACRQTLATAELMSLSSIALPAFGVGSARYPGIDAARIVVRGILDFFATAPRLATVTLAIKDPRVFASVFESTLALALATPPPLAITVNASGSALAVTLDDGAHARLAERQVDPADAALVRARFGDVWAYHGRLATRGRLELEGVGSFLMDTLLGPDVREALRAAPGRPVVFRVAPDLLAIPWELAHDGDDFLCRRHPVARQVLAARAVKSRALPRTLRALLISDPAGDLPGAAEEARLLLDQLAAAAPDRLSVELYGGRRADLARLSGALERADLVHFAGHLADAPAPGATSATSAAPAPDATGATGLPAPGATSATPIGWRLAAGALTPERLAGRTSAPLVAFASACGPASHPMDGRAHQLARAFLDAGVGHYLAALVPVHDRAGSRFAQAFYQAFLGGVPLGEAVRRARAAVARAHGEDELYWASYVLYGDPNLRWTQELKAEEA